MLHRFSVRLFMLLLLFVIALLVVQPAIITAQDKQREQGKKQETKQDSKKAGKELTAEQVAETVIFVYGRREALAQVRRNGIERGRVTRTKEDGVTEQTNYERRFVRAEKVEKDKVRLDQKSPSLEYALIFKDGQMSGIINGTTFTPRQEAQAEFLAQMQHDIDALLRYKENGSEISLAGRDKQKNIDMYVLELVDKDKQRTRYYISAQKWRVLWLEYEEPTTAGGTPVKYRKVFHDYKYAQNTLVPYRMELYANDKLLSETLVQTVTYGVKMDDTVFQGTGSSTASLP